MTILNNVILKFLQILFYAFPISFMLGNQAINLFILLICLFGIIKFNIKLFIWKDKILIILLSLFFLTILISTFFANIGGLNNPDWLKSVLFLRYLILILVLRLLIISEHINLNYFLIFCLSIVSLVGIDVLIQYSFGKNILGFEPLEFYPKTKYYTGIFKEELITGSFILLFSTFGFFGLPALLKTNNKKILFIYFFSFAIFIIFTLLLAGNRMPTIMFLFFLISLVFLYKKNSKLITIVFTFFIISLSSLALLKSETLFKKYQNFYGGIPNPTIIIDELKKDYPKLEKYKNSGKQFHALEEFNTTENYKEYPFKTGHLQIFITSIDLFLERPFIGGGIKSFRNLCKDIIYLPNRVCESHPHNYYLDILNDVGLLGLLLIIFPVIYLLYNNYKDYRSEASKDILISNWVYLAVILSLFIQFFPVKSSGSFFSTFNAAYTFLVIGISAALHELRFKIRK